MRTFKLLQEPKLANQEGSRSGSARVCSHKVLAGTTRQTQRALWVCGDGDRHDTGLDKAKRKNQQRTRAASVTLLCEAAYEQNGNWVLKLSPCNKSSEAHAASPDRR